MASKFEFYNFASGPAAQKETKFQKYLRFKNEHIMEKCFDIKMETSRVIIVEKHRAASEQLNETNHETPTDDQSQFDQQFEENLIFSTSKTKGEALPQAASDQQPVLINESKPCTKSTEVPDKKIDKATKIASNSKRSLSTSHQRSKPAVSASNWKSPFRTFITNGLRSRPQCSEFAYDLSRDELKFAGRFSSPMKPAPESERQLLKQGQRRDYLMQRYEHAPVVKYNYPEATSWRIGWLQPHQ